VTYVNGVDVSNWQPFEDVHYQGISEAGYKFAVMRCTVGDYYSDPRLPAHWDGFGDYGLLRTPYLVVAPADSSGRQINVSQHMTRFISHFGNRTADLPWVLDCELDRGQPKQYITDLIGGIVETINTQLGRYPIIYTRQTWWDTYVDPDPLWPQCPLWAARYTDNDIGGPWGDGYYRFRDWDEWHFWQWTSHGRIPPYTGDLDLDRFNGGMSELLDFILGDIEPPPTFQIKVTGTNRGAAVRDAPNGKIIAWAVGASEWTATAKVSGYYRVGESAYIPAWLCEEI